MDFFDRCLNSLRAPLSLSPKVGVGGVYSNVTNTFTVDDGSESTEESNTSGKEEEMTEQQLLEKFEKYAVYVRINNKYDNIFQMYGKTISTVQQKLDSLIRTAKVMAEENTRLHEKNGVLEDEVRRLKTEISRLKNRDISVWHPSQSELNKTCPYLIITLPLDK